MSSFIVEGGHRLSGSIAPQGAKNEALEVAVETIREYGEVLDASIVLFDREAYSIAQAKFPELVG